MSTVLESCVDCQAEREAAALAWFNENLGQPEPVTRLRREREIKDAAIELGIEPQPHVRYPRTAVIRRWLQVCDSLRAGKPFVIRDRGFEPSTTAERRQRAAKVRWRKVEALRAIARIGNQPVTIERAAALANCGLRTLERALSEGRLSAQRHGKRIVVPIPSLRQYVSRRLQTA